MQKARTPVRAFFVALLAAAAALGSLGCHAVPRGASAVNGLTIEGTEGRQRRELTEGIATRNSPRFLGVFKPGFVYEHELYDEGTLTRDLARIERLLRRRGYYEAKVRAARVVRLDENRVRIEIDVDEGEQVLLKKVDVQGLSSLPFDASVAALHANPMRAGEVFDEDRFEEAKLDISNALADMGYAYVRTRGTATVNLGDHRANVSFEIEPGPRTQYGSVTIEGLTALPEGPIRSTLSVVPGERYSRNQLERARGALVDLGVFSKVEIIPDLSDTTRTSVPIVVRVQESPLRNITAGVGASLDVLRLAASGRVAWSHLNFFGGLRKFTVSTAPTLTFFPLRVDNIEAGVERVLPENALLVSLEQPSFLEGRTRGFISTGYNIYPLLYPLAENALASSQRIIGYNELTASFGVRRNFFGRLLPVSLSMNYRANFPFTYQGSLQDICGTTTEGDACGLEPVVVAYPELNTDLDLRDDPISPTKGLFLSNSLQIAIPALGGQLSDVRIRPEVRAYVPLDYGRKLILAARATFGFVFPQNYGQALLNPDADTSDSDVVRDQHRLLFRAFYSGGPQSNRGYPFQRIGPQGPIGFLVPTGVDCNVTPLPSSCILPLGGFSLWEASLELRWRFANPWGAVFFVDASDVNPGIASFTFTTPHISVGPGLRYMSPIGPIRVDLGFRVPGLQKLTSTAESPPDISETEPYKSETWDQAFALQVLIGEAF
jgi:outer membrane protein assembly factor BamA